MKRALPFLLLLLLVSCSQYIKPRVVIDLANQSQAAIKNVEVDYPGGTYGFSVLASGGVNHHTAEIDHQACVFTVKFEDPAGHQLGGQPLKLGNPCPAKVSIVVDAQMAVSAEPGK